MAPSDSLPSFPRTSAPALYRGPPPRVPHGGSKGPPQLTRPLARHVAPDTPEEPRADHLSYIPECWLPRSDTGSPSSASCLRGYVQVHSRYDLPVRVTSSRGFVESLGHGVLPLHTRPLATGLTGIYPGRHLSADKLDAPLLGAHRSSTLLRVIVRSPACSR
jgi:hypothetical protein